MSEANTIELPSGSKLVVNVAPFEASKALYQALLREVKNISVTSKTEMTSLYKNLFCVGFSSKEIEACVWECLKRCTIDGEKVSMDTFEPVDKREDFTYACIEVTKANVSPFVKRLYAEYNQFFSILEKNQA